jgi:prephenate dehydrogenase
VEKALNLKIINKGYEYGEIDQAVSNSDLVFLCTPITHILELLQKWKVKLPAFKKQCIITDVGSTKKKICNLGHSVFSQCKNIFFIGSHPMTGSEKSGIDARDPLLFENASWVICPLPEIPVEITDKLKLFIEAMGARTAIMSPKIHDKVVAHVSHLPQLLATGLAGFVSSQQSVLKNALQISGGGFRDMTRLANSSFKVWEPIFSSNRQEVLEALSRYIEYLQKIKSSCEMNRLHDYFHRGKALREKLIRQNRGYSTDLAEILLHVPDKPGILASALNLIAEKGCNILDLEILKVREGESGTIRIAFKKQGEAERAVKRLVEKNFEASVR